MLMVFRGIPPAHYMQWFAKQAEMLAAWHDRSLVHARLVGWPCQPGHVAGAMDGTHAAWTAMHACMHACGLTVDTLCVIV